MISETEATRQYERLLTIPFMPQGGGAMDEYVHALERAENEGHAEEVVDELLAVQWGLSGTPARPLIADIQRIMAAKRTEPTGGGAHGCRECNYTGWRVVKIRQHKGPLAGTVYDATTHCNCPAGQKTAMAAPPEAQPKRQHLAHAGVIEFPGGRE